MTSRTRWLPAAFLMLATSACSSSSGSSYNYSSTSQPRAVSSSAPKSKG